MTEPRGAIPPFFGEQRSSCTKQSILFPNISLLTLTGVLCVPVFALIGIEQAQAQSNQSCAIVAYTQGQVRPQRVRRMRCGFKPQKKSFLGGLFSNKPVKRREWADRRGSQAVVQIPPGANSTIGPDRGDCSWESTSLTARVIMLEECGRLRKGMQCWATGVCVLVWMSAKDSYSPARPQ